MVLMRNSANTALLREKVIASNNIVSPWVSNFQSLSRFGDEKCINVGFWSCEKLSVLIQPILKLIVDVGLCTEKAWVWP